MLTFLCRNLFCFLILLACCLETEVASVDVVNLGGKMSLNRIQDTKMIQRYYIQKHSVADPDLVTFWSLDPGWVKKSGSGSGMKKPDHVFPGAQKQFFVLKFLDSLMRIRDQGCKSRIRDKHPGSATLQKQIECFLKNVWKRLSKNWLKHMYSGLPNFIDF